MRANVFGEERSKKKEGEAVSLPVVRGFLEPNFLKSYRYKK